MKKILLIFTLAVLASIGAAFACSCFAGESVEDKFNRSDSVFTGQVISIEESGDYYDVTFEVGKMYKGNFTVDKIVKTHQSSATCGYNFELNENYLVYANKNEGELSTGLCSGTNVLNQSKTDIDFLEQQVSGETYGNFQNIIVEYDKHANVIYYDFDLMLPNPCYSVDTQTVISEEDPVVVDFRVSTNQTSDMCIQVIEIKEYTGTINLDKSVNSFNLYYNDELQFSKNISELRDTQDTNQSFFKRIISWFLSWF